MKRILQFQMLYLFLKTFAHEVFISHNSDGQKVT